MMSRKEKWIYAALLLANIPAFYILRWIDRSPRASLVTGALLTFGIGAVVVRAAVQTIRQVRSSRRRRADGTGPRS